MKTQRLKDGAQIKYYDSGTFNGDDRPIIIFAHGWGVAGKAFSNQSILGETYRIIIPDLRGCGQSVETGTILSVAQIGQDVFELCEILKLKNVHIVAWSMAAMAIWLAINNENNPEIKSLTIIDMSPKISNESDWKFGIIGHKSLEDAAGIARLNQSLEGMKSNWNEFANKMVTRIFAKSNIESNDPQTIEQVKKLETIALENNPENMAQLWKSLCECDARNELLEISIPCLLIYGMDNQLYAPNLGPKIQSMIKGSVLKCFAQSGHAPHIEQCNEFNNTIIRFVNSICNQEFRSNIQTKGNGSFYIQG
jgi:pimeloyl-ACP methyl ester carboxylesterase